MKSLLSLFLVLLAGSALASKLVLVPLDNRPASGQYTEIVGRIGGAEVLSPPVRLLGNFTIPGSPDAILDWLDEQKLGTGDAFVISTDMICYGGLFESRRSQVTTSTAMARFRRLLAIRKKSPEAKLYLYSSIMRLTPSATHDASSYRLTLARYVQARSRGASPAELAPMKAEIPDDMLRDYDSARARNHEVQRSLIGLTFREPVDLLLLGQDDAGLFGPHVKEKQALRELAGASPKVIFCEGIDQAPMLLASRALLLADGYRPTIKLSYSDPIGASKVAPFESQSLQESVMDQVVSSGARVVPEDADYTLYVNVLDRQQPLFVTWLGTLTDGIDKGKPVAIADLNLSRTNSSPDPELYNAIAERGRPMKLLAYSAWNTSSNTIGTAVAAANLALLSRRSKSTLTAEVAQKQFLLYRMANDFAYHTFTRPVAYGMTEGPRKDVIFGSELTEVNDFVQRDLSKFLKKTFYDSFQGRRFDVGGKTYELIGMTDLIVGLPWPRPYEVRLDFDLKASSIQ